MPLAEPAYEAADHGWKQVKCANCGAPVYPVPGRTRYTAGVLKTPHTWHHVYRGQFYSQMTCDPQLAREAARPLMGQLA